MYHFTLPTEAARAEDPELNRVCDELVYVQNLLLHLEYRLTKALDAPQAAVREARRDWCLAASAPVRELALDNRRLEADLALLLRTSHANT